MGKRQVIDWETLERQEIQDDEGDGTFAFGLRGGTDMSARINSVVGGMYAAMRSVAKAEADKPPRDAYSLNPALEKIVLDRYFLSQTFSQVFFDGVDIRDALNGGCCVDGLREWCRAKGLDGYGTVPLLALLDAFGQDTKTTRDRLGYIAGALLFAEVRRRMDCFYDVPVPMTDGEEEETNG